MIQNKLDIVNSNPWNFRKIFKIEWCNRNEGVSGWASAPANIPDFNGSTDDHEDLGIVLALQRYYGTAQVDGIYVSPMTARWAEASTVGLQVGEWRYGQAFGLAWRVRAR